jgi:serine/threonine protein kinase
MSQLNIVKLSETGLHPAEVKALEKISKHLPSKWLAYSNFEFRGKEFGNREVDLVLVTDKGILLVELKNWNGQLKSEGNHWILNGQDRGESPVAITNRKSQILKTLIQKQEGHNLGRFFIYPIVVLCGSANPSKLSASDKEFTCMLDNFCKISSPNSFKNIFPRARKGISELNKEKQVFNRIFSTKYFDPRKLRYLGYVPNDKPIFSHRDNLYQEFVAEQDKNRRFRALLRTWDLLKLPEAYGTKERWVEVTDRERDVVGFVKQSLPREFVANTLLTPVGNMPEEEFSSKYFELYDLPAQIEMLDTYIHRYSDNLTVQDRVQLASGILSVFSELHQSNIAHRDISTTCIWTGNDSSVSISRWLAATYPEGETVGPVRDFLRSGRSSTPEDMMNEASDPFRRDVFLLGALVYFLLTSEHPPLDDGVAEFNGLPIKGDNEADLKEISDCIATAMDWDTKKRYANATDFFEAFNGLGSITSHDAPMFLEELSEFLTDTIPYSDYPILNDKKRSGVIHIYESKVNDEEVFVKVWPGLRPSHKDAAANLRLLSFLGTAKDLARVKPKVVQEILGFGISSLGTFMVSKKVEGTNLLEFLSSVNLSTEDRLNIASQTLQLLHVLHSINVYHGDIKPENIIVIARNEGEEQTVKFVDCPDIDIDGEVKETPEYAMGIHASSSVFSKDRYAMILTICDVLKIEKSASAGSVSVSVEDVELEELEEELNKCLSGTQELLTLDPISTIITSIISRLQSGDLPRIEVPIKNISSRVGILPSDDSYQVRAQTPKDDVLKRLDLLDRKGQLSQVSVIGVNGELRLIWDKQKQDIITGHFAERDSSMSLGVGKYREINAFLALVPSGHSDFTDLAPLLVDAVNQLDDRPSKAEPKESIEDKRSDMAGEVVPVETEEPVVDVGVQEIWRAFIEAEADVLPEILVTDEPEYIQGKTGRVVFPYESKNGQPIEFERGETVNLEKEVSLGQYITIGKLVPDLVSNEVMAIDLKRGTPPSINDSLRLSSVRAKGSYDKRRLAIERIISQESSYPDLFRWFSGMAPRPEEELIPSPDSEISFCEKFKLNDSQCTAINKVLNIPPIGLVQGPPGTGKTYFIAALIYKLLDAGTKNILLTSQSHEAVNNCIDKLITIYSDDLEKLDIVRVGPLSMCSEGVARYHIDNIQQRYRKRFEKDMRDRIEFSAKNLGLPQQFVSQFVRLSIATNLLLEEFESRRNELVEAEEDEGRKKEVQRLIKELESIRNSVYGRTRRISTKLQDFEDEEDVIESVEKMKLHLIKSHDVTNESAISQLMELIDLAFDWVHALVSPHGNFGEFLTRTKRVVCGTCVGIGLKGLNITKHTYEWVIIDEAARCSAGEIAVPAQTAQRLVMVGDHQQLPPMYTHEVIDAAMSRLPAYDRGKLQISDFRRVVENQFGKVAMQFLNQQYRMKSTIAKMVSDIFYDIPLETKKDSFMIDDGVLNNPFGSDVIWWDTAHLGNSSKEKREVLPGGRSGTSFVNFGEISTILKILKELEASEQFVSIGKEFNKTGDQPIGVICTYAGQKRELFRQIRQRNFTEEFFDLIKVDTVDSYQGKENLVIILSLVRNNHKHDTGFLSKHERVNVAISRAMERLIIVGSSQMWAELDTPPSSVYRYIQKQSELNGSFALVDNKL